MSPDDEIIAGARKKAKALYAADERIDLSEMIEQLADIAEQRGAMLVEERAKARRMLTADKLEMMEVCWDNYTSDLDKGLYRLDAMRDLQIGASFSWVHIGPEEREAIEEAIELLEDPGNEWDCEEIIQVLRRLIDGGEHIGEPTEMVGEEKA